MELENNISNEWKEVQIGEANIHIGDGNYSSKYPKSSDFINVGVPFISAGDFRNGRIDSSKFRFISEEQHCTLLKGQLKRGDVLIVSRGNGVGQVAYVEKEFEDCNINAQLVLLRCDNEEVFNLFLYYLLYSPNYQKIMANFTTGSAQPQFTNQAIKQIPISFPPLPEQKAIAKILTAFDDKIELLQSQNMTLETMAQTIFKEWFGKYKIGDELPEGWRVDSLSEIADFLNGLALQKYPPKKGYETLPVIKIRELKQGITSNTDRANTELDAKYIIDSGDVLFSWSGSLEVVIWQYGKGALNQHLFKVSSEIYPKWFYYHWVLHHLKEFKGIASSKATTMGHINRKHLDLAEVIIPDKETFKKLNFLFSPILEKIENNQNLIQSLTKTRDTLLPKLMSGQVRVNNIKQTANA